MSNLSAVLHAPHDLRLEERAVPALAPHQILVQVSATGICGSWRTAVEGGARVLVPGAWLFVGSFHAQVAQPSRAETPVVTDVGPHRLERASQLSLRAAVAGSQLDEEFDILPSQDVTRGGRLFSHQTTQATCRAGGPE